MVLSCGCAGEYSCHVWKKLVLCPSLRMCQTRLMHSQCSSVARCSDLRCRNAMRRPSTLTTACAWHGVHTPVHQVSKNRPRKSSSQMTIKCGGCRRPISCTRVHPLWNPLPLCPEISPPDRALRRQTRCSCGARRAAIPP